MTRPQPRHPATGPPRTSDSSHLTPRRGTLRVARRNRRPSRWVHTPNIPPGNGGAAKERRHTRARPLPPQNRGPVRSSTRTGPPRLLPNKPRKKPGPPVCPPVLGSETCPCQIKWPHFLATEIRPDLRLPELARLGQGRRLARGRGGPTAFYRTASPGHVRPPTRPRQLGGCFPEPDPGRTRPGESVCRCAPRPLNYQPGQGSDRPWPDRAPGPIA